MPEAPEDTKSAVVRDVVDRLRRPIPDLPTLLALLSGPLDSLSLLPTKFRRYNTEPLLSDSAHVLKQISSFQRALLNYIAPTWDTLLVEQDAIALLDQFFCPASLASPAAANVVLLAYTSILSQPLTEYGVNILARITTEYPVDRLHGAFFSLKDRSKGMLEWEDYVRSIVTVPAKVANAAAGKANIPPLLEHGSYFNNLCLRCESLVFLLSTQNEDAVPSVSYLLAKLVNQGVFPTTSPISRSQPSFFQTTLGTIRARQEGEASSNYSNLWSSLLLGLPTNFALRTCLISLFVSLPPIDRAVDCAPQERALVKREAYLISKVVGRLTPQKEELWESATAIITGRNWDIGRARIFVCWASGGSQDGQIDEQVIGIFLDKVLETWTSPEHIKHSLLSHHQYLTALLLIAVSYLPTSSQYLHSTALSLAFISSIGTYVAHLDVAVRRCGMLAAEVIAKLCGKNLDFKDWDGDGPGKPWARAMRELIQQRDVDSDLDLLQSIQSDAHNTADVSVQDASQTPSPNNFPAPILSELSAGYDSDDSITGYASLPSSRSASPTPSELEEIEKDPTLGVKITKPPRPVYLAQLGELLRSTGGTKSNDQPHEADNIEMALNCAAELIRKKRNYGTELEENAVNLVYGLISLQDNYDLDGFSEKRQNGMNALIACCPRKAAPTLIDEFFKNQYSTSQRYAALNALATGAVELASPSLSNISEDRLAFPSKTLPPQLHKKYLAAERQDGSMTHEAFERARSILMDKEAGPIRERRLRLKQSPRVIEVSQPSGSLLIPQQKPNETTFTEVATEYFIAPLINRFWQFLQDEQTREERTAHHEGRQRYHGAGTGLILNPVVLSHFLRTLAVLVHAAQNVPEWLAVVAPDALELAVTLGTKPISHMDSDDEDPKEDDGSRGKEASVLTSALELALVVLEGCLEVDGGRAIGLEHATLLLGVGEWAGMVLSRVEKGLKVEGGGGIHEVKLRKAAVGVVLKVDDLTSKWRRSMLDTR